MRQRACTIVARHCRPGRGIALVGDRVVDGGMAALGRRQAASAAAPVTAVSHWYFGEHAARRDDVSAKYTLSGYLTHHVASMFWALVFERLLARRTMKRELCVIDDCCERRSRERARDQQSRRGARRRTSKSACPLRRGSWCTQLSLSVARSHTSGCAAHRAPRTRAFRLLNLGTYPFKRRVACIGSWPPGEEVSAGTLGMRRDRQDRRGHRRSLRDSSRAQVSRHHTGEQHEQDFGSDDE